MYDFAVVALLALGVVKVVDFLTDSIGQLQRMRSVLTFLAGLGAVWALDYSLFDRYLDDRLHGVRRDRGVAGDVRLAHPRPGRG